MRQKCPPHHYLLPASWEEVGVRVVKLRAENPPLCHYLLCAINYHDSLNLPRNISVTLKGNHPVSYCNESPYVTCVYYLVVSCCSLPYHYQLVCVSACYCQCENNNHCQGNSQARPSASTSQNTMSLNLCLEIFASLSSGLQFETLVVVLLSAPQPVLVHVCSLSYHYLRRVTQALNCHRNLRNFEPGYDPGYYC